MIIGFWLVASLVWSSTALENLQQSLSNTFEEQQPQILIQLYDAAIKTEPETALNYAIQAEKLAIKYNLFLETGIARKQQGNYYYQKKNYSKAIELYSLALGPAEKTANHELLGDLYNNLGQSHTQIKDYTKAREFLQKALVHRKQLPAREDEITSLNNLGMVFWQQHNYQKAITQYLAAVKYLENTPNIKLASATYNNLGNAYVKTGNTAEALDAYVKSLNLKEHYGTPAELASANLNIGNLFYTNNNFDKALLYYDTAHKIAFELGDSTGVATIRRNLGVVHNALKNFDRALDYHQSSLSYFKQKSMSQEIAKTLNNIGNLYQAKRMYPEALDYYKQSLATKSDLQDIEGLAITNKNMGQIYLLIEDYQPALQHTLTSIAFSKQLPDRIFLHGNYLQLSKIYGAMGDYKNAYLTLQDFLALDAALYKKDGQSALAEMIARFGVHEKNKEISELVTIHKEQNKKLAEVSRDKWLFILLSVFVLGIALIIFTFYRLKQREVKKRIAVQLKLEILNHELEERVQQEVAKYDKQQQVVIQKSKLESLGNLAAGIAHEINQPLSAISMSMDNIINKSHRGIATSQYLDSKCQSIQEDIERIRQIIEQVRLFSRDQKDSAVEQVDVNSIVRNSIVITEPVFGKLGIKFETALCLGSPLVIGNRFKLEQVLINLMSNARDAILEKFSKHPHSVHHGIISISTFLSEENILIAVSDNGMGIAADKLKMIFDPFFTTKDPDKGTGLGLSISFGIIRDMGGTISAVSTEGESTVLTISLPALSPLPDNINPQTSEPTRRLNE